MLVYIQWKVSIIDLLNHCRELGVSPIPLPTPSSLDTLTKKETKFHCMTTLLFPPKTATCITMVSFWFQS